ncbi:type II toxin-antitoxin system PemK/MazF family toxin [Propionispora vibrioides]|uniref:mRNA interferase n=1 Tax=Propionispora vibrioides TaxID=112903 RepID=A0A1H8WW43_9FIRM|nr:type II toxin-antitoxin system PemK/MazF family toxin [Propionispora vibrioides]SEP31895.1 mRNA interferase MazF [Propionispora vibrioides]
MIDQYAVYWVDLNPTGGAELNKVRPCVVISPPEMNDHLRTIIIAPVTSQGREGYPTRTKMQVGSVTGWIVLDQIRAIDKNRLCDRVGRLSEEEIALVKEIIREMLVD